jgi:hypothetical protein
MDRASQERPAQAFAALTRAIDAQVDAAFLDDVGEALSRARAARDVDDDRRACREPEPDATA